MKPLQTIVMAGCRRMLPSSLIPSIILGSAIALPAFATDRPPVQPDIATAASVPSSVSAVIQFSLSALSAEIERKVPRRLATFDDRTTECWHRQILGRDVKVDCAYSGYIERVGSIPLRAEGGRITATTPLFGSVSAQGVRGLAALIHAHAEGEMSVFASARPRLNRDWSISLDMSDGFRWTEPPVLSVLGFRINLQKYVEPRIQEQLAHVKAEFERSANRIDIRQKAAAAWDNAFIAAPLVDNPPVWLQTRPQSLAVSGFRARGDVLEGSIEMTGSAETIIGAQPPSSSAPPPLPELGNEISNPGKFAIVMPVTLSYDLLRKSVTEIVASRAQTLGLKLQDVSVYPSAGKIILGLRISRQNGPAAGDWVYLSASPTIDTDSYELQLGGLAAGNQTPPQGSAAADLLKDPSLIGTFQQQLPLALHDDVEAFMTSANTRLNRSLGNGFRSEGKLTDIALSRILLLEGAIRVDFRASGQLKLIYGL